MGTIPGAARVLTMVKRLRDNQSWSGETHLQKAMFFLDRETGGSTNFDFVLYKHGPYSFDLHDTLATLSALCLIENQPVPPYGPRINLTESGERFLKQHDDVGVEELRRIDSVAGWFGNKGVAELERLATALWVQDRGTGKDEICLAEEIHKIKPHISNEDALAALREVALFRSPGA